MLVLFTALFVVVEALDVPLLTDPEPVLRQAPLAAAAVGVGLLVLDVVLPVPSSLVMIAHGAVFGPLLGAALSLLGSLGAALLGFAIGRRGGPLLKRLVPAGERRRADALLARWGVLALVVTRPVPLLAETTVILAGASPLGWRRTAVAALVGSVPRRCCTPWQVRSRPAWEIRSRSSRSCCSWLAPPGHWAPQADGSSHHRRKHDRRKKELREHH